MYTRIVSDSRIKCSLLLLLIALPPAGAAELGSFNNLDLRAFSAVSKVTTIEPIGQQAPVAPMAPIATAQTATMAPALPSMPLPSAQPMACMSTILNSPISPAALLPNISQFQNSLPLLPLINGSPAANANCAPSSAVPAPVAAGPLLTTCSSLLLPSLPAIPSLPGLPGQHNLPLNTALNQTNAANHASPAGASGSTGYAASSGANTSSANSSRDPLTQNPYGPGSMFPNPSGRWPIFKLGNRALNRSQQSATPTMERRDNGADAARQGQGGAAASAASAAASRVGAVNTLALNANANTGDNAVQSLAAVNASSLVSAVQSHSQLTLFSSANQILQGARGQVLSGSPGTIMTSEKDIIILHKGTLTVRNGEVPSTLRTRCGDLKIKERSVLVVVDQGKSDIHIKAVSGGSDVVTLQAIGKKEGTFTAPSGKELIVSENGIDEEELISTDATDAVITGSIEKRQQHNSDRYYLAASDFSVKITQRAGRHVRLGNAPSMVSPMQLVIQNGTQFEEGNDGNLKLINGSLFLSPAEECQIDCKLAHVTIRRNGMIMLEQAKGISRVKALSGPGDVIISCQDQNISLAPGQELVIADQLLSQTEINPADAIARRSRIEVCSLGAVNVAVNDFSIASVLNYAGYRHMIESSNVRLERLLKIAAVVEIVGRGRGQYAYSTLYQIEQKASSAAQKISSAKIK